MIFSFGQKRECEFGPMRLEHIPQCAGIHATAFASAWTEAEFEALVADRIVISDCAVDAVSGRVQGFIVSRRALDEAEILTLAVENKVRNKGIGNKLLRFHINNLNNIGIKVLFLEVSEANEAALKLYQRFSFKQIGKRRSYYTHPGGGRVSAFSMKLEIG